MCTGGKQNTMIEIIAIISNNSSLTITTMMMIMMKLKI